MSKRLWPFQRKLRQIKTEQGADAPAANYLPYALHFGRVSWERIPLTRFGQAWVNAFSGLEGWYQPQPETPATTTKCPSPKIPGAGGHRGGTAGLINPNL